MNALELPQLLDAMEEGLEAKGRPLRILEGETARRSRSETNKGAWRCLALE